MLRLFARSATPRVVGVVVLFSAVVAVFASSHLQGAHAASPSVPARHTGGYVPAHGSVVTPAAPGQNLTYHGGPVMRVNKTYAIYWQPSGYSFSANYKTLINRYFSDVAAASGATSNVYSVETQYYDTTGPIAYSSSFGGSVTDTTPFPANGYPSCGGPSKCLSDGQLQSEIQSVIAKQGWTKNLTTQFFLFTPNNVGSCDSPGSCTYTVFCAYHGYGSGNLIYANQPYAAYSSGCRTGQRPNGDAADDTINVTSHEHREAINDERLNAWYNDATGAEGSDQCAWSFGASLGGGPGAQYNQIINGNHYYLQQEWSNDGSTCLLRYGSAGGSAPTVTSFSPTSGPVGTSVTINGTNFTGVTAVKFNTTAATTYTVNSSVKITATVPSGATTGKISVSNGSGTGTSTSSFTVTGGGGGAPTITSFSPTFGFTGTHVTINGSGFTGTNSVKLGAVSASFTVSSATRITATVPSLPRGSYKWQVTTPNGTATSTGNFVHF
jgi:hypothetical protein